MKEELMSDDESKRNTYVPFCPGKVQPNGLQSDPHEKGKHTGHCITLTMLVCMDKPLKFHLFISLCIIFNYVHV